MTITRLAQLGFESNGTGSMSEFTGTVGFQIVISATHSKTGTYSFRISTTPGSHGYISLPPTRQLQIGMHWWSDEGPGNAHPAILSVMAGAVYLTEVGGNHDATNDLWLSILGTIQDTAAGGRPGVVFAHYGLDVKIHPTTGWINIYKDGILILDFAGNTGNADITEVCFGPKGAGGWSN